MVVQTPSPPRQRQHSFRTNDSDAAWAAAKGLFPVREGFLAPGYAPAHLVGGVTYTVRSPQGQSREAQRPIVGKASVARHLFGEYERQKPHASQQNNLPQQGATNDVSHCIDSLRAYINEQIPQQRQQPCTLLQTYDHR